MAKCKGWFSHLLSISNSGRFVIHIGKTRVLANQYQNSNINIKTRKNSFATVCNHISHLCAFIRNAATTVLPLGGLRRASVERRRLLDLPGAFGRRSHACGPFQIQHAVLY
jgi:hypothetical protein